MSSMTQIARISSKNFKCPFESTNRYDLCVDFFSRCHRCNRAMHKDCISLLATCAKTSQPPALPPRPVSVTQLPMSLNRIRSVAGSRVRILAPSEKWLLGP